MPVRRLQAGLIRDAMLVASGEIDGRGADRASMIPRGRLPVIRTARSAVRCIDGADTFRVRPNVMSRPRPQALLLINGPPALAREDRRSVRATSGDAS
jgi:hypothetical protein